MPVTVGPHVLTLMFFTLVNAFCACFTAVCIVTAGKSLCLLSLFDHTGVEAYMDAIDWNVAL